MTIIDGNTRIYGILGHPVRHTLSPTMYNALFRQCGFNAVYVAMDVTPDGLPQAIRGLRALGVQGVHLTAPLKEAAFPLLDRLSQKARVIGAVNVILNHEGALYGDNTDGRGFLRSIQREFRYEPEGRTVVLLGAGGAARSIGFALASVGGRRFFILNRTPGRAERFAKDLRDHQPSLQVRTLPLTPLAFLEVAGDADLVVDATSPGPSNPVDVLPVAGLKPTCIVSDINYFRADPPLLSRAAGRDLRVDRGLGMLVYQGALSMMLLTGLQVKAEDLEDHIRSSRSAMRDGH